MLSSLKRSSVSSSMLRLWHADPVQLGILDCCRVELVGL